MEFRYGFNYHKQTYIRLYRNKGFSIMNNIKTKYTYKTLAIYIRGYFLNIDFLKIIK